ncbi:MAG: hypothetical protein GF331_05190 [Chitinivibrionales bacterium]|nr:hypothetical protein [Chitinivibrionales bacterium]
MRYTFLLIASFFLPAVAQYGHNSSEANKVVATVMLEEQMVNLVCQFTCVHDSKLSSAKTNHSEFSSVLVRTKSDVLAVMMKRPTLTVSLLDSVRIEIESLLGEKLNPFLRRADRSAVGVQKLFVQSINVADP